MPDIRGHVTVEQTKKSLKMQRLLAILTLLFGIGLVIAGQQTGQDKVDAQLTQVNGTLTIIAACIWIVVLRVLVWWHHG